MFLCSPCIDVHVNTLFCLCLHILLSELIQSHRRISPQYTLTSNYLLHPTSRRCTQRQEIERGLKENGWAIFGCSHVKILFSCLTHCSWAWRKRTKGGGVWPLTSSLKFGFNWKTVLWLLLWLFRLTYICSLVTAQEMCRLTGNWGGWCEQKSFRFFAKQFKWLFVFLLMWNLLLFRRRRIMLFTAELSKCH